jgi:hypothetical protein
MINELIEYHLKNAEKFLKLNNIELYKWHSKRAKFYEKQRNKIIENGEIYFNQSI